MKEKQNKLIAYALDFVSFLVERKIQLNKAILFGSTVTGEFDDESDIDIFLETEDKEENITKLLNEFEKINGEKWRLKGISNQITIKMGKKENWPQLRRSIQSHALTLYSTFKEIPEKAQNYLLFLLNFSSLKRIQKVAIWRKLYGYTQKVKNKRYITKGVVESLDGKKLERSAIAIPSNKAKEFKDFLNKNKIHYKIIEIWTDSL